MIQVFYLVGINKILNTKLLITLHKLFIDYN